MFEFIRVQYALGRLTKEQIWAFVPQYITADEAETIITNTIFGVGIYRKGELLCF